MRSLPVILLLLGLTVKSQEKVKADSLLSYGKKHLGTHYKYGSTDPKRGFDCSGFVYHIFSHFHIKVPRASMDYEKAGHVVHPDSCRPGDVIVFTGTDIRKRKPGHVGIVVAGAGDELSFIHSSSGKKRNGVIISSYKESPYYRKRFIKIVRLDAVVL